MRSGPKKRKVFSVQGKMDILVQLDANRETRVALAARLGIAPSTLNIIVKNRKDTEKYYSQCDRFSSQTVTISGTGEFIGHKEQAKAAMQ
jgi:hypothetical protein